ncbi:helix-turn-helix transcriptional regulator [Streptomyces sp. NPDC037389]|uniref:helix-turn-helix domain-containing protein n=1 Tax=Streptomyces sp. NPDC037389 TaxID=3155369 RepID=UPI0033DEAA4F
MPPRTNPTARQVRLGTELKRLRECAGVAAVEAARVIGVDPGKMSYIESGRVAVSEGRLCALAGHYRCTDESLVNVLVAMTGRQRRGWWEKYRGVVDPLTLDVAELEHHAVCLNSFQVVHVPGILQTAEYVRSLYSNDMHELSEEEVEAVVDFRVGRRQVLDRKPVLRLDVFIHEAALRIRVGDRKVAHDQLRFILDMTDRAGVTVRVIPFERDGFVAGSFPMLYAEAPVRRLDTVQIDRVHGSTFVDDERQLANYRRVLGVVGRAALSPSGSRDFIRRIAQQM